MSTPGGMLLRTLEEAERARCLRAALHAAMAGLGWALVVGAVVAACAGLMQPPAAVRWLLLVAGAALLVNTLRRWGDVAPRSSAETARTIEERAPALKGRVWPAVDLAGHLPPGTSAALAELAHEQALARLQGVDGAALVGGAAPLPWRSLAVGCLGVLFVAAASGGRPIEWFSRGLPWRDPPPPKPQIIGVAPGDTAVTAGVSVTVRAVVAHLPASGARVEIRRPGHMDTATALEARTRRGVRTDLAAPIRSSGGDYHYRVAVGDTVSPWFAVREHGALQLTDARVVYHFPPYAALDSSVVEGIPTEIRALCGTRVGLTLVANNELRLCTGRWGESPCTLAIAAHTATGGFTVSQPATASWSAADCFGQRAQLGPLPVYVIPDEPPGIDSVTPGCDTLLARDLITMVGVSARDDFGLTAAAIRFASGEREDTLLLARGRLGRAGSWSRAWDVSHLDLLPEDVVTYRFEIWDNDAVSGPKMTASRWFSLRFPGLDEIIAAIGQEQGSVIDSLEALAGEGSDLQEQLRDIAAELVGAESVAWGRREDLREVAAQQRAMGERLAQVADELATLERTATEEELFTAELLEKVAAVQDLLQSLRLPELERALQELQQAIDTVSPQELEQALARLAAHQQQILEGLDRAIEMLKKLEAAQRLSSLTRTAERLEKDQEAIVDAPQQAEQADQEARIAEGVARLDEALDALTGDMRTVAPSVAGLVAEAVDRLRSSETATTLDRATSAMRAGSPQAQDLASQALEGLQRLTADLQAAEASMGGDDMSRSLEELAQAERIVSDLALEQRELAALDEKSPTAEARQRGVAEALRVLREQMERSLPAALGPAAVNVLGTMARAQNELDRAAAGPRGARGHAALRALNSVSGALSALRQDLEASACSAGAGMEDLFGLSQSQGQLNRSCRSLLPGAGNLTREMLSSLAARQQLIREQLSRIGRGREGRGSVAGDLGSIGQEMEEVVERLEREGLDEETIRRQQRVLSRLLDAQRSVRRQGVARRRMSEPARRQTPVSANPLPAAVPSPVRALPPRQDDPYPPAYREAIEAYFRAVSSPRP